MTQQVIYSALENGSDNAAINGLMAYLLLAGIFSYLVLTLRDLRRKGISLAMRNAQITWIRTVIAANAVPIVIVVSLLGIVWAFLVWNQYQADRQLLASGGFQSISGVLDDYRAARVWRDGPPRALDTTPGFQPTLHESDRLVVGEWAFLVTCEKRPETPAASVGGEGKCLVMHRGQQIKVDFVELSAGRYRTEPLRITLIQ